MRDDKTKLSPVEPPKMDATTESEKHARAEIERERNATEKYKKQYFDHYDDIKISHREDW